MIYLFTAMIPKNRGCAPSATSSTLAVMYLFTVVIPHLARGAAQPAHGAFELVIQIKVELAGDLQG